MVVKTFIAMLHEGNKVHFSLLSILLLKSELIRL
jgi:hypothetical protein